MKRTIALLTFLALMIPGAAVASANSTTGSYAPQSGVHNVTASRGKNSPKSGQNSPSSGTVTPTATEAASTGTLPFTGLDLAALAAGGVVLLGAGLVLRRVSATNRR